MPWVPDSTTAGYLGPAASPQPLFDDAWDDFLHDLIAGVTGMPDTSVVPRWQPEEPVLPELHTDWVAFGVTNISTEFEPYQHHVDTGDSDLGNTVMSETEQDTILVSFYGPNVDRYFSYLRRGLYVEQNRAIMRANDVALLETTEPIRAPELIKLRWVNRLDVNLVLRKRCHFTYPVRNLVRAQAVIYGNDPRDDSVLEAPIDTGNVHQVAPLD